MFAMPVSNVKGTRNLGAHKIRRHTLCPKVVVIISRALRRGAFLVLQLERNYGSSVVLLPSTYASVFVFMDTFVTNFIIGSDMIPTGALVYRSDINSKHMRRTSWSTVCLVRAPVRLIDMLCWARLANRIMLVPFWLPFSYRAGRNILTFTTLRSCPQ